MGSVRVILLAHHSGLDRFHHYNGANGRSRVLPLQAVGRRGGGARLLDHDRNGPHSGSLGRSAGRLGAARETVVSFGDQRIYASHKSVMFSRESCYFFVRPKKSFLEVCVFLGRTLKAPQVRRVDRASKYKIVHVIQIRHRDEVEAPITDWLREAYELSDMLASKADKIGASSTPKPGPKQKKAKAARKCVAARKSKRR